MSGQVGLRPSRSPGVTPGDLAVLLAAEDALAPAAAAAAGAARGEGVQGVEGAVTLLALPLEFGHNELASEVDCSFDITVIKFVPLRMCGFRSNARCRTSALGFHGGQHPATNQSAD